MDSKSSMASECLSICACMPRGYSIHNDFLRNVHFMCRQTLEKEKMLVFNRKQTTSMEPVSFNSVKRSGAYIQAYYKACMLPEIKTKKDVLAVQYKWSSYMGSSRMHSPGDVDAIG